MNKLWKSILYYIAIILCLALAGVGMQLKNRFLGVILGLVCLAAAAVFLIRYIKTTKRGS